MKTNEETDAYYMQMALEEAKKAYDIMEVPIGAVLVYQDQIIGTGYNRRNTDHSTFAHAEMIAMKEGMEFFNDWRLEETTLYITLEPCPMCAGAIIQARIPKVVIGTMNPKAGSAGSVVNLLNEPGFNHQTELVAGVLQKECKDMMQQFFKDLRLQKKEAKANIDKSDKK